jgi:Flp pilus assembly protein TadD
MTVLTRSAALALVILAIQGCGLRATVTQAPQVEYANPGHKSFRDVPADRTDDDSSPRSTKESSQSPEEFELQGDLMLKRGNFYLAFMNYRKAIARDPDNVRVEFKTGLVFLEAGKDDDALRVFTSVAARAPDLAPVQEGLGIACFRKGMSAQGETHLKKALALDPASWKSHNYLGAILDSRKAFTEAALEYEAALRINPGAGFIYNNLGVSLALANDHQRAVEAFSMAIRSGYSREKVHINLGKALAVLGRFDEAMDSFLKAGGEAKAYNNLGCAYLDQKKYTEAVVCFEKAMKADLSYYSVAGENLRRARLALETGNN